MNSFFNFFIKFFNWSPIFHFSNDEQFGSINQSDWSRFSLLSIAVGENIIYFLTIQWLNPQVKFSWFKTLNFSQVCKIYTESDIQQKVVDYESYLSNAQSSVISEQIEFLKYKADLANNRTDCGYDKTNIYTAIYLAFIPVEFYLFNEVITFLNNSSNSILNYLLAVIFGLSIYYSINCSLFLYSNLKLKGFTRSTFNDLKQNHNHIKLAASYYWDWYSLTNESHVITSIVANIQKYFLRALVISVVIAVTLLSNLRVESKPQTERSEFFILNQNGEVQEKEFLRFLNQKRESDVSVLVIGNEKNKKIQSIINLLNLFPANQLKVKSVIFKSDVLESDEVLLKYEEVK
jgi:hypothetical protein